MLLGYFNSSNGVLLCVHPFSMQILEVSRKAVHVVCQSPRLVQMRVNVLWTGTETRSCFCLSKAKQTLLFWLIDVPALQNFWRPPFIVLPFISYYYSDFCIIFPTYSFSILFSSFFISTVDDGSSICNSFSGSFLLSLVFTLGLYVLIFLLIKQYAQSLPFYLCCRSLQDRKLWLLFDTQGYVVICAY